MLEPLPPGRSGFPLVGETLQLIHNPQAYFLKRRKKYGPVFRSHLFGTPVVFLCGAEANRWIFGKEYRTLVNKWPAMVRRLIGPGSIAMLEGDEHKLRRRLLAPYFTPNALRDTVGWIDALTQEHLESWPAEIRLVDRMKDLTFDVAIRYLIGPRPEAVRVRLSQEFEIWLAGLFSPVAWAIPGSTFAKAIEANKRMHVLLGQIVSERRAEQREEAVDILDTLLSTRDETSRGLDHDAVVDELQTFLFAGHDTTVTSITNILYDLARHPDWLAELRTEQGALGDGPMSLERLRQSPKVLWTIQESLRTTPPIGNSFRMATEDLSYAGYRIPKGWSVVLSPRATHTDPELFPEPSAFDPRRFAPERAEHRKNPNSWIPFGGGARVCIGQHFAMYEMQMTIARIARDFEWDIEDIDGAYQWIPFPRPKNRGKMKWRQRACRRARAG